MRFSFHRAILKSQRLGLLKKFDRSQSFGSEEFRRMQSSITTIHSNLALEMILAYQETEYKVLAENSFTLNIGLASTELADWHLVQGVDCSTFITACNPFSISVGDVDNTKRNIALAHKLSLRQLAFFRGLGQHPTNNWPPEPSYLVFGLDLDEAIGLGKELEQNAIVWSDQRAIPQLVLLK